VSERKKKLHSVGGREKKIVFFISMFDSENIKKGGLVAFNTR